MALPKLDTPVYELELPSTGETIKYRPFLVKEQKLLMIAQESDNEKEIIETMSRLVSSCTFDKVDANMSPLFDVEYVFLKMRSKSVGSKTKISVLCPDDDETYAETTIDLDEISVQIKDEHTNEIGINDKTKMIFNYPLFRDVKDVDSGKEIEGMFTTIKRCVREIRHGDDVYNKSDITDKELDEFLESLDSSQFQKIINFFDTMPKLRHVVNITNPNTKVKSEVIVEGLQSFLE
tara:strand:- start:1405 stop:2109 length:705 start_codon:yes stop_codon:yes gene_type:complete